MSPLPLSTMIDPNPQLEGYFSSENSNNIFQEPNNFKKTFSEFIRDVRVNHLYFMASAILLFMFIMLLINIIYSFYNRKVIKNRKKNINYLKVIELNDV